MNGRRLFATATLLFAATAAWPQSVRLEGIRAIYTPPSRPGRPRTSEADPTMKLLLATGRKRISEGKAATGFKPSPRALEEVVAGISFTDPDDPKTPQAQRESIRTALKRFHARMKQAGLRPNDFADACAMVHALYYQAYYGRRLDGKALKTNRETIRRMLLKDPRFQGIPDLGREVLYDRLVAIAMYAVESREQSVEATNDRERKGFVDRARRNAVSSGLLDLGLKV